MSEAHFSPLPAVFHHLAGHSLFPFEGTWPELAVDVMVAPGSRIIGAVSLAAGSSVWFNAVLRGDLNAISVGERTNIQDGAVLHVVSGPEGGLSIGRDVVVGHSAILHACTIGDRVLVGMGATVLDGAVIEDGCIIAAGAVVTPRTRVAAGSLVAGIPAKVIRQLGPEAIDDIAAQAGRYVELARRTQAGLAGVEPR
jgi:carbonic anhydrase/acetyltransferase-like protein (isoleucine patch superfamily)